MRATFRLVLLATAGFAAGPALAQTKADPPAAPPPPVHHKHAAKKPAAKSPGPNGTSTAARLGPAPALPAAAPPPAVIPPPDAAPPHPTAPPPPPVVHNDAPGETAKIENGLRLTFGTGRSDFNPATEQALKAMAHTGAASPAIIFNLYAHAVGGPEDPSTPRRLSLERALAVRSALINAGIASTRIYVHAMGSNGTDTDAPADRVDLTLANLDSASPPAAPATAPATP